MMQIFFRSLLGKLLAAAAIATGVGLGVGVWLQTRLEAKLAALRFEQPEIDLRQSPTIESDPIDVVAHLHNFGKVPVRITNMATCCGVRILHNEEETSPTEIASGGSLPIHLRIDTFLSGGEAIKHLRVEGQTADGLEIIPSELVISTYIIVPLAVYPESSSFIVDEEELSAPIKQTVVLADLWPGEGLPIKSITSTMGDNLHYQLAPTHGEIGIGSRMLHKRYNLELSFTLDPAKTAFDHTITITPDHPKAKPVEVRLFGKIIPRCGLETDSIAFCGTKPGEKLIRRIEYRYRNPLDREIRLVQAPSWLRASVSDVSDGLKVITLTCTLPDCNGQRAEEARFEYGRDKKQSVLPIFLSCQADDPKRPG